MNLPKSIWETLRIQGVDCIKSTELITSVDNYAGFSEVPGSKAILNAFVNQGVGAKVLNLFLSKKPWEDKMQSIATLFTNKNGFNPVLVDYIFECLEYGLGWVISEPDYGSLYSQQYLESCSQSAERATQRMQLLKAQTAYIHALNSQIVDPVSIIKIQSGYYPPKAKAELWAAEQNIASLAESVGQNGKAWCKKEKQKVLTAHSVPKSRRYAFLFLLFAIPILIQGSSIYWGIQYLVNKDTIKSYNSLIAEGDQYLKDGQQQSAIESYQNAVDLCGGPILNESKKNIAAQKASRILTPILDGTISEASKLCEKGLFSSARDTLASLNKLFLSVEMTDKLSNAQEELQVSIDEATSAFKLEVLSCIRSKGKKLDLRNRERLEELLKVSPDDYWLNLINTKSVQ